MIFLLVPTASLVALQLDMWDDVAELDADFKHAFLCCIPKPAGEKVNGGQPVHAAGDTRPITIVDAANRIIAAILSVALERCAGSWIYEIRRGFVYNRKTMS